MKKQFVILCRGCSQWKEVDESQLVKGDCCDKCGGPQYWFQSRDKVGRNKLKLL